MSRGSIASSAPLTAKTNFFEYMEVVANSIEYFSGDECNKAFESAAEKVAKYASEGPGSSGYLKLDQDFVTCSPMTDSKDLSILLSDLMGNVQGTVQYNNEKNGVANVTNICAVMLDVDPSNPDYYGRFVGLSKQYMNSSGLSCHDISWNSTIEYLSATKKDPTNNARPWTYQTCNEFGYYQTTDSTAQV